MSENRQGRRSVVATGIHADAQLQRELEVTVLTQVRDSLSLINANLGKLDDKVAQINDKVIALLAAKFDDQITELKNSHAKFMESTINRLIEHDRQLAKVGVGMAISAAIGGCAIGGLMVTAINSIYGGN